TAAYRDRSYPLATHEYADGTIDPHGYRYLREFRLEGLLPVWVFECGDALLERRLCMRSGANTTYIVYRLIDGTHPVTLTVTPLVTFRDFHSLRSGQGWQPQTEAVPHGVQVSSGDDSVPYWLLASSGSYASSRAWWWNFAYREEEARGLDHRDDLFAAGTFTRTPAAGEAWTPAPSTGDKNDLGGEGGRCRGGER